MDDGGNRERSETVGAAPTPSSLAPPPTPPVVLDTGGLGTSKHSPLNTGSWPGMYSCSQGG